MNKLALGLVALVVAACGGGGGGVKLVDAAVDAPMACNPYLQTGCMAGEKCTWVVDLDPTSSTNQIGHTGGVSDGANPDGAPCSRARMGVNGGADSCVAGDVCVASQCKKI